MPKKKQSKVSKLSERARIEKEIRRSWWVILNAPLVVAFVVPFVFSTVAIVAYLLFIQEENVGCSLTFSVKEDVLVKKYRLDQSDIDEIKKTYENEPYRFNLSFENYQEALAYREILSEVEDNDPFLKYNFGCFSNKTTILLTTTEKLRIFLYTK